MKTILKKILISDEKIFLYYWLLAIPFSLFVISLDHKTCFSCDLEKSLWEQVLLAIGILCLAMMIAFITNILYNIFISISGKTDSFISGLILGFVLNFIMIFCGLILLWPVLIPLIIVVIICSIIPSVQQYLHSI